ncbi:hypothetical protein [Streptococcus orisratti]|uniref:hypothetical protein n=1 Tax=Streptococcus orisratti TaxID=114652 RepID=UPI0023F860FF|nr:hypothetical protein [Streptococcus orisratti]
MWTWIIVVSLVISIFCLALFVLFVLGWLISSHQIRYAEGYDMEFENDSRAIVDQTRKGEE